MNNGERWRVWGNLSRPGEFAGPRILRNGSRTKRGFRPRVVIILEQPRSTALFPTYVAHLNDGVGELVYVTPGIPAELEKDNGS